MKTRIIKKIMRYIREKKLKKLKSYLDEHDEVDPVTTKLLNADSLLHLSCSYGRDDIMRYLLKKGADPLLCNGDGNLPLHLACFYLRTHHGESYVYEDLIEPLVTRSASCLDLPNNKQVTCRQLLESISAARLNKMDAVCSDEEATSDDEWKQRLAGEMMDEYAEQIGSYSEDVFMEDPSEETWDDWASRMAEEYRARHQGPLFSHRMTRDQRKRTSAPSEDSHDDKRPKIDSKKRDKFEKNIREEHKKMAELKTTQSLQMTIDLRTEYEKTSSKVFSSESHKKLKYKDIPWPHEPGSDIASTEHFLFCGLERGSEDYRKYLKAQQIRWHPDRFRQKCDRRLAGQDRDVILEKVKRLSQLLNQLAA